MESLACKYVIHEFALLLFHASVIAHIPGPPLNQSADNKCACAIRGWRAGELRLASDHTNRIKACPIAGLVEHCSRPLVRLQYKGMLRCGILGIETFDTRRYLDITSVPNAPVPSTRL